MKNICDKSMNFQECELAILRASVDKAEERSGRAVANSGEVKKIINIVAVSYTHLTLPTKRIV